MRLIYAHWSISLENMAHTSFDENKPKMLSANNIPPAWWNIPPTLDRAERPTHLGQVVGVVWCSVRRSWAPVGAPGNGGNKAYVGEQDGVVLDAVEGVVHLTQRQPVQLELQLHLQQSKHRPSVQGVGTPLDISTSFPKKSLRAEECKRSEFGFFSSDISILSESSAVCPSGFRL